MRGRKEASKVRAPVKKLSVSKSLKNLFQPANKFVRTLQRGVYLAAIFYHKNNILVSNEDQIPLVEIDSSCSSLVTQEFLWFTKVASMWKDVQWLQQGMNSALSSSSSVLQTRQKLLKAASHLQVSLGAQDLGHVYFEPLMDQHGNSLIVTMKELPLSQTLEGLHWTTISKLQACRRSTALLDRVTILDKLLGTLKEKVEIHKRSSCPLQPGLYLGYLKLCSSLDRIKVLVPQGHPNVLCHTKIRDNYHLAREEWEWLQTLRSPEDGIATEGKDRTFLNRFLRQLQAATSRLLDELKIPAQEATEYRLYTQEVLEFGHDVSFLLVLPPSEDICSAPGQGGTLSGFFALPLQMFEMIHFSTYEWEFFCRYCQASVLLELDSQLSHQALREALDRAEVQEAKERLSQVMDLNQQLEDIWREVRWIMDVLHYARYRQPRSGVLLPWILEIPTAGSYGAAPESWSKHLALGVSYSDKIQRQESTDSRLSSDEDDVFWPTDSDYNSSTAQTPNDDGINRYAGLSNTKRSRDVSGRTAETGSAEAPPKATRGDATSSYRTEAACEDVSSTYGMQAACGDASSLYRIETTCEDANPSCRTEAACGDANPLYRTEATCEDANPSYRIETTCEDANPSYRIETICEDANPSHMFEATCEDINPSYRIETTCGDANPSYRIEAICEDTNPSYRIETTCEDANPSYRIETTCEDINPSYRIETTCGDANPSYRIEAICEDTNPSYRIETTCEDANPSYRIETTCEDANPSYRIETICEDANPSYMCEATCEDANPSYRIETTCEDANPSYRIETTCEDANPSYRTETTCGDANPSYSILATCGEANPSCRAEAACGDANPSYRTEAACGDANPSYGTVAAYGDANLSYRTEAACANTNPSYRTDAACGDVNPLYRIQATCGDNNPSYRTECQEAQPRPSPLQCEFWSQPRSVVEECEVESSYHGPYTRQPNVCLLPEPHLVEWINSSHQT
ncbi:ankyrin repeat and fibronectin type-III domain-containing protein 1-like [Latimeria chalumnae]|uniref:ankyrin repeat and fibronectin type-III domain-containing protein 1-like n=1 Tax=Latimeria chalumnae TaxID=7897 RepID=UPI00313D6AA1